MALVMPLAGKLTDRLGGGPLALFGVTRHDDHDDSVRVLIGAHTSVAWLSVAMFVRGIGIGFAFMPAMAAAFASLKRSELPDATPQLNVLQRVGGSIGTAVLAVVLQRALVGVHSVAERRRGGLRHRVLGLAGLTALAIIPCIILRARRARGAGLGGRGRRGRRRGRDAAEAVAA